MKFQIFHAKNPDFGFGDQKHEFPKDFEHVANAEAHSLENVFELTNHIDTLWFDNEGVEVLKRTRSTSVGDVVVDATGKAYSCAMCGWVELT